MARTTDAGNAGEAFVAGRLVRAGYRIVDRNWRIRGGEIDIIALDGETLVFVEVKVRTGERIGYAEDTLDARKLSRLMVAAEQYVNLHSAHQDRLWRVDFVAVTLSPTGVVRRYSHVENVTLE
ncbi:MAG TPA: YraN family protein [Thermomicrobiales bacterium]|nr:YraN family protein [Thermomicrobiales bacterium]